jgi:hypothetical protein
MFVDRIAVTAGELVEFQTVCKIDQPSPLHPGLVAHPWRAPRPASALRRWDEM